METSIIFWLALVGLAAVGGIGLAKADAQRRLDTEIEKQHYLLHVPSRDLEFKRVADFTDSLYGLITPLLKRLGGITTIAVETEKDINGFHYRISVPAKDAGFVIGQLEEHIPGTHAERIDGEHQPWHEAIEVRMTSPKSLRIGSPEATIKTILSSFGSPKENESVMMQWVFAPSLKKNPDEGDKDHKEKHREHTFLAVGRIAARAGHEDQAKKLIWDVFKALDTMRAYGVSFRSRSVHKGLLHKRLNMRSGVLAFPCYVNTTELATILAFPAGNPNVPGLPQGRTRRLPADPGIPKSGLIMAISNVSGAERPLALSPKDLTKHLHILGSTGVGKSTALENLIIQQMRLGLGVTFLDPHGDSFYNLANAIPKDRIDDVILLDLTDSGRPIGFNVLEGDPYHVTSQVMAVWDKLYDIYKMSQTADILRSTVLTLAKLELTLLDIPGILAGTDNGQRLRDKLIKGVDDPALKDFWRQYNALKPERKNEAIAPVLRRLRPFETWPSLRGCLSQTSSGFDFKDVLNNNKILLVNLSKGRVGEEESKLFGSLFVAKFWNHAQQRPSDQRDPYLLCIDEFQNYVNLPVNFGDVLTEARKYGLGFVIAHQHMAQLPFELREAVMPNARNKMVFQTAAHDASMLATEMPQLKGQDFQNLGQYETILRLTVADRVMAPATGRTLPPSHPTGSGNAVRASSAAKYGRPLAQVEAELQARQRVAETPKKAIFGREEDEE